MCGSLQMEHIESALAPVEPEKALGGLWGFQMWGVVRQLIACADNLSFMYLRNFFMSLIKSMI